MAIRRDFLKGVSRGGAALAAACTPLTPAGARETHQRPPEALGPAL